MEMYRNFSLKDMEGEIWLPVVGYEGLYEVSNMGRVKTLNFKRSGKEKIMKQSFDGNGYLRVGLRKDGKLKLNSVHRLVAQTFIENKENKLEVDHISTVKTDNRVENLKWATRSENANNPLTRKHNSESRKGKKHTEETKKKISETHKRKVVSEETRKKIGKNNHNYKGFIALFPDGSITEEMSCENLGKLLGIDGEMIRYVAKSGKPYKPRSKRLKHLAGIKIYYYQDYLKLESGDNNVA